VPDGPATTTGYYPAARFANVAVAFFPATVTTRLSFAKIRYPLGAVV